MYQNINYPSPGFSRNPPRPQTNSSKASNWKPGQDIMWGDMMIGTDHPKYNEYASRLRAGEKPPGGMPLPPNPSQSFLPTDSNTASAGGNTPTAPASPSTRPGGGTDFTGSAKPPAPPPSNTGPSLPSPGEIKPGGNQRPPIKPGGGYGPDGNLRPGLELGPDGRPRPINYSNVPYNQRPLNAIPQNLQGFYQNNPNSMVFRPQQAETISSSQRPINMPSASSGGSQSKPFKNKDPYAPQNPNDMVFSPGANYKDDPMYSTREMERRQHFEGSKMQNAEAMGLQKYEFQNQRQRENFIAQGGSWDTKNKASGKHPFERLTSKEYGALTLASQAGNRDAEFELKQRYQSGQRYIMDSASAQALQKNAQAKQSKPQPISAIKTPPSFLNEPDSLTQARDINGNEIRASDMLTGGGVKLQKQQRAEKKPESGLQFRKVDGKTKFVGGSNKTAQRGPKTEVRNGMLYSDFGGQTGGQMSLVAAPKRESGMR